MRRLTGRLVAAMGVLLLVLIGAGCARGDTEGSDQPSEAAPDAPPTTVSAAALDGTTYVSTSVSGHKLVEGTEVTLSFQDGLMTATAGCNTLFSPYEIEQDTLRWTGTPATTLMECPEAEAAQDRWVTGLLSEGSRPHFRGSADLGRGRGDASAVRGGIDVTQMLL